MKTRNESTQRSSRIPRLLLGGLLCFGIACGSAVPIVGIDRLGYAEGTITAFGSIYVNGIHFETEGAEIIVDDAPGSESDLRIGQVVRVEGTINDDRRSGVATRVVFDDDLQGAIESIDVDGGQIVVLGQAVLIDAATSFDDDVSPGSIEGLDIGDFVEVSGFFDTSGAIRATRIELAVGDVELHGVVSGHDPSGERFFIGSQEIDYGSASLEDFGPAGIQNGDFVEVKAASHTPGTAIVADEVELEGPDDSREGQEVSAEGYITRFGSTTDFDVSGRRVTTNAQTVYEDGQASDLGPDVKVEVDGHVEGGVLIARKIEIRRGAAIRIAAHVDSVNAAGGRLVILGITVHVDALTRLEDKSDADVEPFRLADIATDDYLEVRASMVGSDVVASRVERDDDDDGTVELRGFIESLDDPDFTILGVTIETDGLTDFQSPSWSDQDEFFGTADVGDLVEARGLELAPTTLRAEEVQDEDD